jgi:hypothetical protein
MYSAGRRDPMPMYYFNVRNSDTIRDPDGTELADDEAARGHATAVARELMYNSEGMLDQDWSQWFMTVHNDDEEELFSFPFSEVKSADGDGQ